MQIAETGRKEGLYHHAWRCLGDVIIEYNRAYHILVVGGEWHTKCDLLSGIRRQAEGEYGKEGDDDAGDDEVDEIVDGSASHPDAECDVVVLLRARRVVDYVSLGRHVWRNHR